MKKSFKTNIIYQFNKAAAVADFKTAFEDEEFQRELNKKHVKEIKQTIMEGQYGGKYIPAIRVGYYHGEIIVADGNHTLNAFREAWEEGSKEYIKVLFIELPQDRQELRELIIAINNTQRPWDIKDYSNARANSGNEAVINLKEFAETHALCQSKKGKPSIRYAGAFFKGYNVTKEIKENRLNVTDEEKALGYEIYPEVEKMVDALGWQKNNWLETFIQGWRFVRQDRAYVRILNEIGFKTFLDHILEVSQNWQMKANRTYWEGCFRTAIWLTNEKVQNHEWQIVK